MFLWPLGATLSLFPRMTRRATEPHRRLPYAAITQPNRLSRSSLAIIRQEQWVRFSQLQSLLVLWMVRGNPVSGQVVVFTVTQNNGTLDSSGTIEAVTTDSSGHAQAHWELGTRSGSGNNIVEATSVGFADSAIFTASGTPGNPGQVSLDAGNDQIGAVGQPLPYPFVVVITDASTTVWPTCPSLSM